MVAPTDMEFTMDGNATGGDRRRRRAGCEALREGEANPPWQHS